MVELAWAPDRIPSAGEHTATVLVAIPNAADTASRDQSQVSVRDLRKTPNGRRAATQSSRRRQPS
jgi:hypothetical protein